MAPISINLEGAADTVELVKELIVPWRRKHAEKMAELLEQEKQAEIESKKAEILELRATNAKRQSEIDSLKSQMANIQAQAEKLRLENEKNRLELEKAKIEFAFKLLEKYAPNLPEQEKVNYLARLLPSIGVLMENDLQLDVLSSSDEAG